MKLLKIIQDDMLGSKYKFVLEKKQTVDKNEKMWIIRCSDMDGNKRDLYNGLPVGRYCTYAEIDLVLNAIVELHKLRGEKDVEK